MKNNPTPASATSCTITGHILDAASGQTQPCWVTVEHPEAGVINDWQVTDELRGFPCDGRFEIHCPPGEAKIRLQRLLTHEVLEDTVTLQLGEALEKTWRLQPWVDTRALNFIGGESHDHLNRPHTPERTALYCRALGIGYLNACQSWMHSEPVDGRISGEQMARRLESVSTPDFHLHFGGERPKTRYGHVWWLNLKPFADPFGEYMSWHDPEFVAFVQAHPQWCDNVQRACPLRNELPFITWRRYRQDGGAFVAAHPTSWWLEKEGDQQIVTNISAELPFMLLSGEWPDALAVMGYDPDQVFYQALWFHLLNEGYPLAACGETDGELKGRHHIGQIVSYTRLPPGVAYSPAALVKALREARTVMSSGPFILFSADQGRFQMGDRIPADHAPHTLDIEAWSAPEPRETLSWIVVYRNGRPYHIKDLRGQPARHVKFSINVREPGPLAWYVVKAYGRKGPDHPAWLDVLAYVDLCGREPHTEYRDIGQVALTNPIWFTGPGWKPPAPQVCNVNLRVTDKKGVPATDARVRITDHGKTLLEQVVDSRGGLQAQVPPTAEFTIIRPGMSPVHKSIFLDYRPVNECMESCYSGRWRKQWPVLLPGQVPWEAFRLHDLKQALERVDWTVSV